MITLLLVLLATVLVSWTAVWFISPIAPAEEHDPHPEVHEQRASFLNWVEDNPNVSPHTMMERWHGRATEHENTHAEA